MKVSLAANTLFSFLILGDALAQKGPKMKQGKTGSKVGDAPQIVGLEQGELSPEPSITQSTVPSDVPSLTPTLMPSSVPSGKNGGKSGGKHEGKGARGKSGKGESKSAAPSTSTSPTMTPSVSSAPSSSASPTSGKNGKGGKSEALKSGGKSGADKKGKETKDDDEVSVTPKTVKVADTIDQTEISALQASGACDRDLSWVAAIIPVGVALL